MGAYNYILGNWPANTVASLYHGMDPLHVGTLVYILLAWLSWSMRVLVFLALLYIRPNASPGPSILHGIKEIREPGDEAIISISYAMFIKTVQFCRLLREKPNTSQTALESMILYKRNKTADWLKAKSDEEKKTIFQACIKVGRNQRIIYKQRKKELISYREETLKQRE